MLGKDKNLFFYCERCNGLRNEIIVLRNSKVLITRCLLCGLLGHINLSGIQMDFFIKDPKELQIDTKK